MKVRNTGFEKDGVVDGAGDNAGEQGRKRSLIKNWQEVFAATVWVQSSKVKQINAMFIL